MAGIGIVLRACRQRLVWPSGVTGTVSRGLSVTARACLAQSGRDDDDEASIFGVGNLPSTYHSFRKDKDEALRLCMSDPDRFQPVGKRETRSAVPTSAQHAILAGKYYSIYRGMDIMKAPMELMVYMQLFWHERPRTVVELGAYTGASAVWMADMLRISDVDCNIFSVDLDLSLLHPRARKLQSPKLSFLEGDCREIEHILPPEVLSAQPHPWLVIDDCHENMHTALDYFHRYMVPGDYLVCEDTVPTLPVSLGAGGVYGADSYEELGPKKLNMWRAFLGKHRDAYAIDTFYTDYYGYNSTSNWDGFARRLK